MTNFRYVSISNRVLIVWPCACPGSLTCTCTHVYSHMYTPVCMLVYTCILLYTRVYRGTHVYFCILLYTCVHMYTSVYSCILVYTCILLYTHVYLCILLCSLGLPPPLCLDSYSKQCNIYEQCNSPNNRIYDCEGATNEIFSPSPPP